MKTRFYQIIMATILMATGSIWAQDLPPIQFTDPSAVSKAAAYQLQRQVPQVQGWSWATPKLVFQANQRDQISNLQVVDTTLYFIGAGNKVYRLTPSAVSSAPATKVIALDYQGGHQILGAFLNYSTGKQDIWETADSQLNADSIYSGQPWLDDVFTASNLGDSLITLSLGRDELSIAERRGNKWTLQQISGTGHPARFVFPREAATDIWDGVRFIGMRSGIAYMAIAFHALGDWYIQAFQNVPTPNGSVGGTVGPKIAIYNDGEEMGMFYRNGDVENELVFLYSDPVLYLRNGFNQWPIERFQFSKEIRAVGQNGKIAAVGVNDGNGGNVYVYPYYRLRQNMQDAFAGPTLFADTLALPIGKPFAFDITGLTVAPNGGVYVSVDYTKPGFGGEVGEIWFFENLSTPKNPATISLKVPSPQPIGRSFWVDVNIANADSLTGAQFQINFSNTLYIDVDSIDVNTKFFRPTGQGFGDYGVFEDSGRVFVLMLRGMNETPVSGSGTLARVRFRSQAVTPSGTTVSMALSRLAGAWRGGRQILIAAPTITVEIVGTTTVDDDAASVPTVFALGQNYPNPFNPSTTIAYDLPRSGHVLLRIFNALGQEVRTLVAKMVQTGYHQVIWDGRDDRGSAVPSGVYFYRIETGEFVQTKKMILVR